MFKSLFGNPKRHSASFSWANRALGATGLSVLALILLILVGCAGSGAPAQGASEATPVPAMPFDPAGTVYQIVPGSSEARFKIGELLRGEPKTVVGVTNQVSGQISANLDDLSTAAAGPIQVDARTLITDNDFRNRAIHTRILLSRVFETVTFTPTAVSGLPDALVVGDEAQFQIIGDLTIIGITRPVTFEVTAVLISPTRIEGSATTSIQRGDFDLFVPSATGVAGVEETVILELDFVAEAEQ